MNNIERLEKYLLDEKKGYLARELSNGKIMMLSGKWGSGKTHFWKEILAKKIEKHIYISLYGKTSIKDIEYEVFAKAYYLSLGREKDERDTIEKLFSTFSSLSGAIDSFADSNLKVSSFMNFIHDKNQSSKDKKAKKLIKNGLVICFDDFERKSSNIDLQDLFGFITNLALQYKAKIVIILNDDVFKGEDKTIFTNVKEKSLSKYLLFSPTSSELFDIIFETYKTSLKNYKDVLKNTFEEVNLVNARILIQILDNVNEWIKAGEPSNDETLRLLSLININFILYHFVFEAVLEHVDENGIELAMKQLEQFTSGSTNKIMHNPKYINKANCYVKSDNTLPKNMEDYIQDIEYSENIIESLKYNITIKEKKNSVNPKEVDNSQVLIEYLNDNELFIKSFIFMEHYKIESYFLENNQSEVDTFNKVNTFIETGIL